MTHLTKLTISNFTDPMMGLSYESEPFFRKLETHFGGSVELKYIMSGLVRDVYGFVDPADLEIGRDYALRRYNTRLAKIYESEEYITGMPINMADFQLFSEDHTSSLPLNLAYKAAQLADKAKSDLFLYNLRYATIVETRPTTHVEEIVAVARQTQIDLDAFKRHYENGSAQAALDEDFALRQAMGVRTLPAYLFEYGGKSLMVSGVLDYDAFAAVIEKLTDGEVAPTPPKATVEAVRDLINRHPLISPIELRLAFGLQALDEVHRLIGPLVAAGEVRVKDVGRGWFIEKL